MDKGKERTYSVFLKYNEDEEESYIEMKSESLDDVQMAARGWLMCSFADSVIVYDEDGFDVAAYIK